ncbi:MAG: hypothetical protein R3357_15130 [Burkholderiales bacterium]|nr:hypothetical protein [Burkholderiales bacterium]
MSLSSNSLLTLCAVGVLSCANVAAAADTNAASEARARYLDERARCMRIESADERKTCLREAGAAQIEARRGTLTEAQENYAQNRLARCAYYKDPKEREYCVRRMRGEGTTTGSVEEGAIVRSLVVTVPASE